MTRKATVMIAALVGLGLAVSACGRKGPLEPPPGAVEPPPRGENEAVRPGPRASNPDRPFILDGLI